MIFRILLFQRMDRARREGWPYRELPTGHDCHVEMPDDFAALLMAFAAAP